MACYYLTGRPCDERGEPLPSNAPPLPMPPRPPHDFTPFASRAHFEFADFLYRKDQMSGNHIDELMQLLAALYPGQAPPFADRKDLYEHIDSITVGEVRWESFTVTYIGPRPSANVPSWMDAEYRVWFRCPRAVLHHQLANPSFKHEMDFTPKKVFHGDDRVFEDFMSGDWVWQQAVCEHYTMRR